MKTIYLAGGCFWGAEKYLGLVPGVVDTNVGYANGRTENPSYEDVKYHQSGHAETVRVKYDETKISLERLLEKYFEAIDPVSVNKQGEDEGIQYRTGIYYTDREDLTAINAVYERIAEANEKPLAVEVLPLVHYYEAEDYHQKYLDKNPQGYCHLDGCMFERAKEV
ncbi:MAG: peptide-methionine (S)-S-oxide reductase MsrA [Firmicutes bacterium]|nr:peptide-methionine (S)-S-oxide reductase MsrA [Bacillota bacterium]MBQ2270737.1 peptide-methionine (S)-S-oxide reductase MsrA [Bacillota bacterium]